MLSFESDYIAGAHPDILRRLAETNLEPLPGYGTDKYCESAREKIRAAVGCPEADVEFLAGGTQTNALVIAALLPAWCGIISAETGHIAAHEAGAVEYTGHKVISLPQAEGKINSAGLSAYLSAFFADENREHMVHPGMVYLSWPTEYGALYSKAELEEISALCKQYGLYLFIDGARLGYGLEASGCDILPKDLPQIADVFYIGGTKQGALFGEAVVFSNPALAQDFRYNIKQNGGMLAKGRLLGIQFETLMNEGLYFKLARHADRMADRVRDAFRQKGFPFLVENTTNQVFPILPRAAIERLSADFGFECWQHVDAEHDAVRFCTSWATPESAAEALVRAVKEL